MGHQPYPRPHRTEINSQLRAGSRSSVNCSSVTRIDRRLTPKDFCQWQNRRAPELGQPEFSLLRTPTNSVLTERSFSAQNQTPCRSRLQTNTFDRLVFSDMEETRKWESLVDGQWLELDQHVMNTATRAQWISPHNHALGGAQHLSTRQWGFSSFPTPVGDH